MAAEEAEEFCTCGHSAREHQDGQWCVATDRGGLVCSCMEFDLDVVGEPDPQGDAGDADEEEEAG
jgi:hypothetical protein